MNHIKRLLCLSLVLFALVSAMQAEDFSAKEVVLEHIKDSHDWHVTDLGEGKSLVIPLPVIVYSSTGWHVFCSSEFEHHAEAYGLRQGPYGLAIATEGDNAGKIVENGEPVLDLSITKTVAVMFINVIILLCCILFSARWYKKRKASDGAPGGFVGFVEMLVMYVVDDIIKPGVGKGYEKYTPYLLTCFFFIFTCNVMGLIPFPPGSGNAPIPIIPVIEFVGIFTKPFALMIRLFANMMAGHAIAVAITCIIFLVASQAVAVQLSMSALSVIMSVFMMCLECLVCFIQAMVFTMLSAVFIGLARVEPEHE